MRDVDKGEIPRLPNIDLVLSVEMIRDGGSLAAIFQGSNGSKYWLFFEIKTHQLTSGEVERLGYKAPVIVERQVGVQMGTSWQHAQILLNQLRPLVRDEASLKWLDIMEATAVAHGELPTGIDRSLGKPLTP
jgi:hypothetical protein